MDLEYNKNLYKEINLGYDPYQLNNIDEKGKSYLRIYYNDKFNLSALRENFEQYNLNIKINKDFIKPINKRIKYSSLFGFISSLSLILMIAALIGGYKNSKGFPYMCVVFLISFLIILILVSINIFKLK